MATAGDGQAFTGGGERLVGPGVDITSNAFSLSGWVNRGASAIDQRLVAKTATEGTTTYELLIDGGTNEAVARIHVGGSTIEARGGTVTAGTWTHVAATWNGTLLTLYVDGAPVDSVAAAGSLSVDPDVPVTVGNIASADRSLTGTLDQIQIQHRPLTADEVATTHATESAPDSTLAVGAQQTGAANPWTVTGTQTRSGSFALEAPTAGPGTEAWATAVGIDEPGLEVDTWWWYTTGIDIATGVRTGTSPTDQWETALTSAAGYDLGRHTGGTRTQDAPQAGTTATGAWVKVTVRTDQNGDTSIFIDDTEIIAPTNQGGTPASGSVGLRAGTLGPADNWYIDDIRARKLTSTEPTTTLGPLDRS